MKMSWDMKGIKELNRYLDLAPEKAKGQVERELQDIGSDLMGEAQRRAPVDTGDLRGSAFTETENMVCTVGFTEPYALRQHEGVDFAHPRGGEAKFLENPYKEKKDKYIAALKGAVKKAVEEDGGNK